MQPFCLLFFRNNDRANCTRVNAARVIKMVTYTKPRFEAQVWRESRCTSSAMLCFRTRSDENFPLWRTSYDSYDSSYDALRCFLRFRRGQDTSSSCQRTADAICHAFPVKAHDIRPFVQQFLRNALKREMKSDSTEEKLVRTRVNDKERN